MWPMSAIKHYQEKRAEEARVAERDRTMNALDDAIATGNKEPRGHLLCNLCTYAADPIMAGYAVKVLDRLAAEKLEEGVHTAVYMLNCMKDKAVHTAVSEKAFEFAAKVDKTDENLTASVAMVANLIASGAAADSDLQKRGVKLWHDTVDTLATTPTGIQFAFAAASNAALGGNRDRQLRVESIITWEKMVTKLATTDKEAALKEATRVAEGYKNFGEEARPFRRIAYDTITKLKI